MKVRLLIACVVCMTFSMAHSQEYLGIYGNALNFTPLFADGNSNSVPALIFTREDATSTEPISGSIGVSAVYTAQTYAAISEGATAPATSPHPGLMFGAQSNNLDKLLLSKKLAVAMNDVGTPSNTFYSPTESISAMSVTSHYGFSQYASVEELHNLGLPTLQSQAMGTIVYTFTRPVDNPILHVTGLGGFFSSVETGATQLFSVDYEFVAGGGATGLARLNGTSHTVLDGNTIKNDYTWEEYAGGGSEGVQGDDAGSGSFLVMGTNVTSVTFNVIMVGKSPEQEWTSIDGEAAQKYTGDRFNSTWTLPLYTFGGSVVIDNLQNGSTGPDDGFGEQGGPYVSSSTDYEPLFAVLVDDEGNVADVVPVDPTDGTFDFAGVLGDSYTVQIQTSAPTVGDPAPSAATLPAAYETTEEEFVDGGSDGDPNSITNPFLVGSVSVDGITDENLILGIRRSSILPVEFISFTGELNKENVDLEWLTASEVNSSHFIVERSLNGTSFDAIGKVDGQGNTLKTTEYTFTDENVTFNGKAYYRLKQVDLDGAYEYSDIVAVSREGEGVFGTKVYPNPAVQFINIEIETSTSSFVNAKVIDMTGKVVIDNVISQTFEDGVHNTQVPLDNLNSGTYIVRISAGEQIINHKILVLNR